MSLERVRRLVHQRDAVGLSLVDTQLRHYIKPRATSKHLLQLINTLEKSKAEGETALAPLWHQVAEQVRQRGLVIILSDCFDNATHLLKALQHLRYRRHEVVLFHILGPSIASLDEINETAGCLGDANYFLVKNFINNTHFFEWDEATHASYFKQIRGAVEITIPKLNEMATEQVELASLPYVTFVANKKQSGEPAAYSFVLRGYVRHWLGNVCAEYDRIGLIDILAPRAASAASQKRRARA